jgi:hypothetical protein
MKHGPPWKAKRRLATQSSPCMEHVFSLPYSLEISTGANEFRLQLHAFFPSEAYALLSAPKLGISRCLFPSSFSTYI